MRLIKVEIDEMRMADVDFDALRMVEEIYKLRADSTNALAMALLIRDRTRSISSEIQKRRAFGEVVPKLQFETPRLERCKCIPGLRVMG